MAWGNVGLYDTWKYVSMGSGMDPKTEALLSLRIHGGALRVLTRDCPKPQPRLLQETLARGLNAC